MARDALKKVRTGDPLTIPAAAYNAFVDAARAHQSNRRDPPSNQPIPTSGTVLIRNDTGEDVPRFGVLGIDRPIIGPGDNEQAFKNRIALSGVKPDVDRHTGRFAILAEPLKKGKIGRAFVTGVCPVKIKVAADSSGSGSGVVPSSSEPVPSSSTAESSNASSSAAASSSGSQSASASGSAGSSVSSSTPASSGVTSSGSHPQSSGSGGGSGSGSPGSGGGSGGTSSGGGSGGGGSGGGGSGGGNTSGSSNSASGSSSSSSNSSGGIPTFWYHLVPCDDDSSAQHNLYIVGNDVPSGQEDCVPRPSSSGGTSGSASGSGSGQGSGGGGSGGGGSGGGGSGGPGGGSGSGVSDSGASGSQGSGGSQLSGASSGQSGASGSGSQSGSATQSSSGSGGTGSGAGSSGGHGGGESSGSTTAQPVSGPLFLADIADRQTDHLIPCPWGAAAVLWVDEAASGSASSDGEARWAIVRLDGGQSVGDPFLAQIELADGSSGNCLSPANWTYNVRSLRGDKLADGVAVLKPRALGRTTPNTQGYGLAVRVLDGDKATLKLWDAGELHDDGPCEEASSSASGSSSSSVSGPSSGSSASVSSSASGSGASSSPSVSSSTGPSSSTPPSGSAGSSSAVSGSLSGPASSGSNGDGSGGGGSGGGGSGGGGSGGSGGGGSGGGGSGGASGSSGGTSGNSSSSGSASGSPSSSGSPPTTIKYNGVCYSVDDSAGYITLPSDAQIISPAEWWADCDGCKATCCASHNSSVCRSCFASNSTADMTFELTETYFATDYSPQRTSHWKFSGSGPIDCNNAHWSAINPTVLYEEDGQDKTATMCGNTIAPSMAAALGGNQPDWWMAATRGTCGPDIYGSYGTLFAGKGNCQGIHESVTQDITFFGPNPDWNPGDPNSPMEIEQTVGTRTIKYDVSIKNNSCCMDDQGNCQNRGQGQTYCDGGCVEEPPLP